MEFSAEKIASFLKGEIEGDKNVVVNNISKIEEGTVGTLSFLANMKYTEHIYQTKASIVLVNKTFKADKKISATLIRVDDAYKAFASLLELYSMAKTEKTGISPKANIEESAKISGNVYLGSNVYIGENVVIEENVKIYPNSYIGDNSKIGENTTIFSGVNIYSESQIGKNCTIHSGVVIGSTILRKGVKLDNFIQIAHNVEIGENTVMASLSGVSGSTKIGKNCMIGGQVGFAGHINITDDVKIGAQTGVLSNITEKGSKWLGTPAINMVDFLKVSVVLKKLPEMKKQIEKLEKIISTFNKK